MEQQHNQTTIDQPDLDLRDNSDVQQIEPRSTIPAQEPVIQEGRYLSDGPMHETSLAEDEPAQPRLVRSLGAKATAATSAISRRAKNLNSSTKEFMTSPEKKPLRNKVGVMAIATAGAVTGLKYYQSHSK